MPVSLVEVATQIGAEYVGGADVPGARVTGVTLRAQHARPGDLFAALPGANTHGAQYASDAVAVGAVAVLTDPAGAATLDLEVPLLIHPAPR